MVATISQPTETARLAHFATATRAGCQLGRQIPTGSQTRPLREQQRSALTECGRCFWIEDNQGLPERSKTPLQPGPDRPAKIRWQTTGKWPTMAGIAYIPGVVCYPGVQAFYVDATTGVIGRAV